MNIIDKIKNLSSKIYNVDKEVIQVFLDKGLDEKFHYKFNLIIHLPNKNIYVYGDNFDEFKDSYLKEFRQVDIDLANAYIAEIDFT